MPVLVCLTFADKLYAEHMKDGEYLTDESKYPDKISTKHKLQAELAVSYARYVLHTCGSLKLLKSTIVRSYCCDQLVPTGRHFMCIRN